MASIPEEFSQEFITEELSINHKLFPHEKSNGRYYSAFKNVCPATSFIKNFENVEKSATFDGGHELLNALYKVREYRENAPKYLQELIDDIDDSKTFSELCEKRPHLTGLDEQLALAAGYSARTSISLFKEAMKRRIFVCLCRNERFHTKLFCGVSLKERFSFYEDLMAKDEDLVALVVRCRELFGSEKRLAGHGAVDFGSILG